MLVIIFMLLRLMMMVLRANPMAMRVVLPGSRALRRISISTVPVTELVVLPGSRALRRISISAVPVTELVVKKPSCYPVRAIGGGSSETPDALSLRVPVLSDACYSFIFRLLFDITPLVGGGSLAVLLEAVFLGR